MSVKTLATLTSLATGAAIALSAGVAQAAGFVNGGVTGLIMGYQCPTTTCVDLATGGYATAGGAVLDPAVNITNVALTPGSDIKGPDTVNDASSVTSYNITSRINNPLGAIAPIVVTGLGGAFDFFWGSVDTYNVLEFFNGDTLVGQFTGTDVATAAGITTHTNVGNYMFDAYVGFTGNFDRAVLSIGPGGTGVAFEVATKQAVPEPATLLGLAAVGLVAGGSLMKRKGQSA